MDAIRTEQLSRRYGDVQALKPLDLAVPAGAIFGFLGRNGAGKTTTIRLLTGLARPTTGRAWIHDVETTNGDSQAQRQFGYLPQEPAFYGWMTPRGYLDYVAQIFDIDAGRRKPLIGNLLAQAGLEKAADRAIAGFSGGMKQRLGLAQALIQRPPVLILDEPMSGMDLAGRREVIDLLAGLRGQVTVFFSSHILADVERVCDIIGILHEGELLVVSEREALLDRYAQNAVELELDHPQADLPAGLLPELRDQPWVAAADFSGQIVRVVVTDVAQAKQALLPLALKYQLPLLRYEWMRPSLEEIFLAISAEPAAPPTDP